MLKWFAPILVFTTEEIYNLINNSSNSIHEMQFPKIKDEFKDDDLDKKWKNLYKIKQEANIAIEEKRSLKEIGSSLEAEIEIYTDERNFKLLEKIDLTEYFITSKAGLFKNTDKNKGTIIKVKKTSGDKCPRCWKILETKCTRCEEFL